MANLRFASYGCCRTTISPLQARGWAGKASQRLQVRENLFLQAASQCKVRARWRSPCRDGALTTLAERSHGICQEGE